MLNVGTHVIVLIIDNVFGTVRTGSQQLVPVLEFNPKFEDSQIY